MWHHPWCLSEEGLRATDAHGRAPTSSWWVSPSTYTKGAGMAAKCLLGATSTAMGVTQAKPRWRPQWSPRSPGSHR